MEICCIGDLHGFMPDLGSGDLLIVCGDLTATHTEKEHFKFNEWLENQKYKKIIVVAGNHDTWIEQNGCLGTADYDEQILEYLCDSGTEFEGLKIWGSPWTKTFPNMNPHCKAFTCETEEELSEKWAMIPDDIDILITHSPPYGIRDKNIHGECCGSKTLLIECASIKPLIHCFGHLHESYGDLWIPWKKGTKFINCSHVNERYQSVNKPVRIIL